jgi:penicillin-binding protein
MSRFTALVERIVSSFTAIITRIKDYINVLEEKKILKASRITGQVVWNLFLIFLILMVVGGFFAGGVGAGYFASLVKNEPIRSYDSMQKHIYNYEETSQIYFQGDKLIGKLNSDIDRKEVPLEEISQYVRDAIIATEDQYFNEHPGVVPKAISRAIYQEISGASIQTGGSTLTQQLIKNQILTNEVSFDRKAKEILLALRLERFFDKDEILEAYLNVVPFGRNSSGGNIAGVQAAAKGIFGVDAKDLNLVQSAFIAGLPQSPFGYTPFSNKGELKASVEPGLERMRTVLSRMLEAEKITEEEYNDALAYDITKDFIGPQPSSFEKYPALTTEIERRSIDILAKELAKQEGKIFEELEDKDKEQLETIAKRNLRQNGYHIYTTIDQGIHDMFQKVKNDINYGKDRYNEIVEETLPVEVGATLIENKTGAIISFVGGRDYYRESKNHATQATNSTGSTIKPWLDYAGAFETGIAQPGSIIPDLNFVLNIPGQTKPWAPKNYSASSYKGLVTARTALKWSYNIPAARLYHSLNKEKAKEYIFKMGFTTIGEKEVYNPSLSIGGMTNGVTVEENTNAYAMLANNGKFIDAYMIEKIVDNEGKIIYEHEIKPVTVYSPQTAYLTLDMMRDVYRSGTAARVPGKLKFSADWAGKTGTSQEYYDAWFVATNPNISLGVWIGYDYDMSLQTAGDPSYSSRNQNAWATFANAAYDVRPELMDPKESFKSPGGIVTRSFCTLSGKLPSDLCREFGFVGTDIFNAKFVPRGVDDSLERVKIVTIGETRYRAMKNTPQEFTEDGVILKKEFLDSLNTDKQGISVLKRIYKDKKIMFEEDELKENGKVPGVVQGVSGSSSKLSWKAHSEKDVVGYRIYRAPNGTEDYTKMADAQSNQTSISISGGNFTYRVTAVDIAGRESKPSNSVMIGELPKPEPKDPPKPPGEPGDPPPKDDDGGGGDPGNGGENGNKPNRTSLLDLWNYYSLKNFFSQTS